MNGYLIQRSIGKHQKRKILVRNSTKINVEIKRLCRYISNPNIMNQPKMKNMHIVVVYLFTFTDDNYKRPPIKCLKKRKYPILNLHTLDDMKSQIRGLLYRPDTIRFKRTYGNRN